MTEKRLIVDDDYNWVDTITDTIIEVEDAFDLVNELNGENKKLKKENLDLSEELDYYKAKCASLETGLFQADRENKQLKMENKELKLLVQSWEALDEEKDEQLEKQNQALKKLKKKNEQLKSEINMLKITIGRNEGYINRLTHTGEWK